jgi:glycerol-3-phosphate cytidylyltransferase
MKTVITYGTFDLHHIGYVNLLRRANELGSKLFVDVPTGELNEFKGKKIIYFNDRCEVFMSCKYVHHVFPEEHWEQKVDDVKKYMADIFVMGDDWLGKFDYLSEYCDVHYLSRTEGISSSLIKYSIGNGVTRLNK